MPQTSHAHRRRELWARVGRILPLVAAGGMALIALHPGCSGDHRPAVLSVDPEVIQLNEGDVGGAFTIRNAGGGTLHWLLRSEAPWAVPETSRGITLLEETTIPFAIAGESLSVGPSTAVVRIESNGGAASVLIRMWQALAVAPDSLVLSDSLTEGSIVLENPSGASLSWIAAVDRPWLGIEKPSGVLAAPAETVRVSVSRAGLDAGLYQGSVRVDAGAYGQDTVDVFMSVGSFATVWGHVFHRSSRIPISGVQVRTAGKVAVSDDEGFYSLGNISPGTRWLNAERDGYETYGESVTTTLAGLQHDIELFSEIYQHQVSGVVSNHLDHPISEAEVVLLNPDGSASTIQAATGSAGRFQMAGVPQGTRAIRLSQRLYHSRAETVIVNGEIEQLELRLSALSLPPPVVSRGPEVGRHGCRIVQVSWPPRREETVAGYRVLRALEDAGEYADISGFLEPGILTFDDPDVAQGAYGYRVLTVNIDGVAGSPSPMTSVEVRPWSLLRPNEFFDPSARWGHSAVLADDHHMYIYAGTGCESGACGTDFRDLWGFDFATHEWTRVDDRGGPQEKRMGHSAIYDRPRNRIVIFGGGKTTNQTGMNDTWAVDLATRAWTRLNLGGAAPRPRFGHTAIRDSLNDRMIVYGGRTGNLALNDVWSFDLITERWEMLRSGAPDELVEQPAPRSHHCAVLVQQPGRHWMVVYGGWLSPSAAHRDSWAFDLDAGTWIRLPDGPGARALHVAVFATNRQWMVIYGGRENGYGPLLADVHVLALEADPTWMALDLGTGADIPPPRFGAAALFDPSDLGMVVTGGNLSSLEGGLEVSNEVWTICLAD
ncbi:MAG: kelch repeat-containing protein [Candidatus Eisenbacteria bacterium]